VKNRGDALERECDEGWLDFDELKPSRGVSSQANGKTRGYGGMRKNDF
jgi:hypothetical protein